MGAEEMSQSGHDTRVIRGTTAHDCGGRCPLKFHVQNGVIVRIEGDDAEEPQQLRACLRCRAYRQFVYHPDRLKFPMRRVGVRGEGKFERISWDEALDTIAGELERVKETYGNSAIFLGVGGGCLGALHSGPVAMSKLLNMFGGHTTHYGNVSSEGCIWAVMTQYGTVMVGNSREDLLNSRLIIMWGWDPAKMISGTDTMFCLIRAREAGSKIVAVAPRYHDSAATLADQWIPVRPGTDTAMMISMAYVMIRENLQDQRFLDTYTIGFDKFKDYVVGVEDGIKKTPAWAEPITGVPAARIEQLAREYATTKPAALMDGMGPARSAMGEQFTRCAMTLAAMTGNIGIPGGHAGGGLMGLPVGHMFRAPRLPVPKNPVEAGAPPVRGSLDLNSRLVFRIHTNKMFDAMLRGKAGGYPTDIKFAWFCCNNFLNQLGNTNKAAEALEKPEFIVVPELFMTPTAKFADILLPVSIDVERNDLARPWPSGPYYLYANRVVEPLHECKSDFEIACELAPRLGILDYSDKTEDEWLREFVKMAPDMAEDIADYDKYKREGIHRVNLPEPIVAFKEQIEDPGNNPFPTPSGKIEIYSQRAADLNNPLCPPIPKYLETWEGPNDPLAKTYPLQLITDHPKVRAHSTMHNVPWLKELDPQRLSINPVDAEARDIKDGAEVIVFNSRGKVAIPAWITERIMPGVVCIFEGGWYDPDDEGIDRGGCVNALTRDEYSAGGATTMNTALVEVIKEA
ncbi:MAG: molybdopterin-dependent oxidoreductase [Dehalococcoidia bacterium]|nr:molybdopterin-dependent oxidoreductase [Dehalococcoidia bacterium]